MSSKFIMNENSIFNTANRGIVYNNVNLFTGNVTLSIPLARINGRNNLSYSLSANYWFSPSNTDVAPLQGIGGNWFLSNNYIQQEISGEDKNFYWVAYNGKTALCPIDSAPTEEGSPFALASYEFWKIYYNEESEQWNVTDEYAYTYTYSKKGDNSYLLTKIQEVWGDTINFLYQDSRLQSITNQHGDILYLSYDNSNLLSISYHYNNSDKFLKETTFTYINYTNQLSTIQIVNQQKNAYQPPISFNYYNGEQRLRKVTLPTGGSYIYKYQENPLTLPIINQPENTQEIYPISTIVTNDGHDDPRQTNFTYNDIDGNANYNAATGNAQFSAVRVQTANKGEEYSFYTGTDNLNESTLLTGYCYQKAEFDAKDKDVPQDWELLTTEDFDWEILVKDLGNSQSIGYGRIKQTTTTCHVEADFASSQQVNNTNVVVCQYNLLNGLIKEKQRQVNRVVGQETLVENIKYQFDYAVDRENLQDDILRLNLLAPVIGYREYHGDTLSSQWTTVWKQWSSKQGTIPAAWKQYQRASSTDSPDIENFTIKQWEVERTDNGVISNFENSNGETTSLIYDATSNLEIAIFEGAINNSEQQEAGYYGFSTNENSASWSLSGGSISSSFYFTGSSSYQGEDISVQSSYFSPSSSQKYLIGAWVYLEEESNCTLGFYNKVTKEWAEGEQTVFYSPENKYWHYIEAISNSLTADFLPTIQINGEGSIDHIRFSPVTANFAANVYNLDQQVVSEELGENGTIQKYIYNQYQEVIESIELADYKLKSLAPYLQLPTATVFGPSNNITSLYAKSFSSDSGIYNIQNPNQQLEIKAATAGYYDNFSIIERSSQHWQFTKGLNGEYSIANNQLQLAGEVTASLESSSPTKNYGVRLQVNGGQFFGIRVSNITLSYQKNEWQLDYNDQTTLHRDGSVANDWLLLLIDATLYFYGDGKLIFSVNDFSSTIEGNLNLLTLNEDADTQIREVCVFSEPSVQVTYLDGFNKPRQQQQLEAGNSSSNGNNVIITQDFLYDKLARPVVQTKPARLFQLLAYNNDFVSDFNLDTGVMTGIVSDYYQGQMGRPYDNNYPYYQEAPALTPIQKSERGLPGSTLNLYSQAALVKNTANHDQPNQIAIDGWVVADKEVVTWQQRNIFDNIVYHSGVSTPSPSSALLKNEQNLISQTGYSYDLTDLLREIQPPNYFIPRYQEPKNDGRYRTLLEHDFLGRVVSERTADVDTIRYAYNQSNVLRFVLSAQGDSPANNAPQIVYHKYDKKLRVLESGYIADPLITWETVKQHVDNPNWPDENIRTIKHQTYEYDGSGVAPYRGRLTKVSSYTQNELTAVEQTIPNLNGKITKKSTNIIDAQQINSTYYAYDLQQKLIKITYPHQLTSEKPLHTVLYKYNRLNQVIAIGKKSKENHYAAYTYFSNGSIKEEALNSGSIVRKFFYNSVGDLVCIDDPYSRQDNYYGYEQFLNLRGQDFEGKKGYFALNKLEIGDTSIVKEGSTVKLEAGGSLVIYGDFNVEKGSDFAIEMTGNGASFYDNPNAGFNSVQTSFALKSNMSQNSSSTDLVNKEYDEQGRIRKQEQNGIVYSYQYDANGNVISQTTGENTSNYSYDAGSNRLKSIESNSAESLYTFSHDLNGNVTSILGKIDSITYDPVSQMPIQANLHNGNIKNWQYGLGNKKLLEKTAGKVTIYLEDLEGYPLSVQVNNTANFDYIVGPTGLIAIKGDQSDEYLIKNIEGSTTLVVDESGDINNYYTYSPTGIPLQRFGIPSQRLSEDTSPQFLYEGMEYDENLNVYYTDGNLYDPETGRFHQPFWYKGTSTLKPSPRGCHREGPLKCYSIAVDPATGNVTGYQQTKEITYPYAALNGMLNDFDKAKSLMSEHLRSAFGEDIDHFSLVHNPTDGLILDSIESLLDKVFLTTPAAQQFAEILEDSSKQNINWVAHSQGGLIFTQAVSHSLFYGRGDKLSGRVQFNAGANNHWVTNYLLGKTNIEVIGYNDNLVDAVPQIIGLRADLHIERWVGSLLYSPTLYFTSVSPHTFPYKGFDSYQKQVSLVVERYLPQSLSKTINCLKDPRCWYESLI